jgi:hypothetical protein
MIRRQSCKREEKPPCVTLEQRLAYGSVTVQESCALAKRSKTKFYEDVKSGLVAITKTGRRSLVSGPVAQRYARGESARVT